MRAARAFPLVVVRALFGTHEQKYRNENGRTKIKLLVTRLALIISLKLNQ